jgi:hypothetical protein
MPQQIINIGALPNDGNGDPLRVAFDKINTNFGELYLAAGAQGPEGAIQFRAPATLVGVAYLAGQYLVAAQDRLYTSADGVGWTDLPSPIDTVTSLTTSDTSFILTGTDGAIYSSTDGVSWFDISLPNPVTIRHLAFQSGATQQYVAVCDGGAIYTSNNAILWLARSSGVSEDLLGVAYGDPAVGWVAVGAGGTVTQSQDGLVWTPVSTPYAEDLRSVAWDGTYYVAVGESGLITGSLDGVTWSTRTSGVLDDLNVVEASNVSGNTFLFAYGNNGRGLSSDDSIAWSSLTTGVNKSLLDTTYTGNLFITVGTSGTIISSTTGNTWADNSIIPEVTGNANFVWDNQAQILDIAGDIIPQTNNSYVLGTSTHRWANAHVFNFEATGNVYLGDVGALTITGGFPGYVLSTDGSGALSWVAQSGNGGGGNANPGGPNSSIQFNNGGNFGGSSTFTFDASNHQVVMGNLQVTGHSNLGGAANITILGGSAGYALKTDGAGNLSWEPDSSTPGGSNGQIQFNSNGSFAGTSGLIWNNGTSTLSAAKFAGNGYGIFNVNGANVNGPVDTANYAGQVTDSAQPNITSVGTMSFLDLTGNFTTTANITANNIRANGRLTAGNRFDASTASNVALGYVGNIRITGGINGQVLTTDGLGNLSWTAGGGGGGGSPGGSNGQVQFNNAGTFGGSAYLNWNDATNTFNVAGNFIANSIEIGSGVYRFSHTNVYFATTSTTANSELLSFDCTDLEGLDFTIIATNQTIGCRQISKLSAITYQSTLNYNEYSTLVINGQVGNFTMDYSPGNIIVSPAARLYVEPANAAVTTYKILITRYE